MDAPPLTRNRSLWTVMSGHFAVDHFSGLMPALYPLLVASLSLSVAQIGLLAAVYQTALSLTQPVFGWLADRVGTRWLSGLAVLWMAAAFAALGWAGEFGTLLALAALAGLGSGAYHPMGAMNASLVIAPRQRNTAMSLYTLGGTAGVALGPIVGATVMGLLGKQATALLALPGLAIGLWLLVEMRVVERLMRMRPAVAASVARRSGDLGALARIVAALMIRSSGYAALTVFLTVWFQQLGYGPAFYSIILTLLLSSAVVGTFLGGVLADRLGRRRVMLICLFALGPLMLLFVQSATAPPLVVAVTAVLAGIVADAPFPLALVTAQRLMPGKIGMASGLILGFTFSAGGFGAFLIGQLAGRIGLTAALSLASVLPLIAALLFLTIPADIMAGQEAPPAPATSPAASDA
ncbi:MAG: MFS transporter [Chloroflexi bacterium]|nr:MFS transporter [Chloroflexota bacterium]